MIRTKSVHHYKRAKNEAGQIGIIGGWSFADSNYFLNCETGEQVEVGKDLTGITILTNEEWNKEYKAKNYPDALFENGPNYNWYRKTNGELGHTERQKNYGLIHDIQLTLIMENGTNGVWNSDFCRGIANVASVTALSKDPLFPKLMSQKVSDAEREQLITYYLMGTDSVYSKWCDKMGLGAREVKASDEDIVRVLKIALASESEPVQKTINNNPMFAKAKAEFDYYMNLAKS